MIYIQIVSDIQIHSFDGAKFRQIAILDHKFASSTTTQVIFTHWQSAITRVSFCKF